MLTIARAEELDLIVTDAGMSGAAEQYRAAGVRLEIAND
jgi:hypothetical protein